MEEFTTREGDVDELDLIPAGAGCAGRNKKRAEFSERYPVAPDEQQGRLYAQRSTRINRQGQRIRALKMWRRC